MKYEAQICYVGAAYDAEISVMVLKLSKSMKSDDIVILETTKTSNANTLVKK